MTVAQQERAALVTTMRGVGPEQPTLCGDWTTRDLAAHLVIRERRLDAAPGILVPKFAGYTERVQNQVAAENDWNVLLDQIASGPPLLSPFKLLDPFVNVAEMFIHHEDVRRAVTGWEPRELDAATTSSLAQAGQPDVADDDVEDAGAGDAADARRHDVDHRRQGPRRHGDGRTRRTADVHLRPRPGQADVHR